jgi:hypothetical protein
MRQGLSIWVSDIVNDVPSISAEHNHRHGSAADFHLLGPHPSTRLKAGRLARPRILWLNERWWLAAGYDIIDARIRTDLEHWLMHAFAASVPIVPVRAGSGDADSYHAQGGLSLEEAVRETVCSEVAGAEFPHGAVPVVALIDAGPGQQDDDGTTGGRRVVLVRPGFVRLADMLRSARAGSSGAKGSDRAPDLLRTRDVIERLGRQIGFSRAARLWPGPFSAANYTVDGALVDFRSFRSLPDWRRAFGETESQPFGDESRAVSDAIGSVADSPRRHAVSTPDAAALAHHFRAAAAATFRSVIENALRCCAPGADADLYRAAVAWCVEEFEREQHATYVVADEPSPPSLYDRFIAGNSNNPLARLLAHAVGADGRSAAESVLKRLLDLRTGLVRERLVASASALSESRHYHEPEYPEMVATMIETRAAAARRHWPLLPERHLPLRHLSRGYCAVLECLDSRTMRPSFWASGTNIGDDIAFFGHRLPRARLTGVVEAGNMAIFPLLPNFDGPIREVRVAERTVPLPGRWTKLG